MSETKVYKRRNISGVYIFDTFPGEDKRQPTCFEDCTVEKQDEWLNSLDPEAVKNLAKHLGSIITHIADTFDIETTSEAEEN